MEELPSVHTGNPESFCLVLPEIFNRELLPIAIIPDILYRESLWVFPDGFLPQARRYDKGRWISADYLRG
jgi:hypothetical protein